MKTQNIIRPTPLIKRNIAEQDENSESNEEEIIKPKPLNLHNIKNFDSDINQRERIGTSTNLSFRDQIINGEILSPETTFSQ